jgi:hypothetical protein
MKVLLAIALTSAVLLASVAEAAGKKRGAGSGRVLGRFDRNQDTKIDNQEAERLRRMYSAVYALDTDRDGKLSDSEISAAKVVPAKRPRKAKSPK